LSLSAADQAGALDVAVPEGIDDGATRTWLGVLGAPVGLIGTLTRALRGAEVRRMLDVARALRVPGDGHDAASSSVAARGCTVMALPLRDAGAAGLLHVLTELCMFCTTVRGVADGVVVGGERGASLRRIIAARGSSSALVSGGVISFLRAACNRDALEGGLAATVHEYVVALLGPEMSNTFAGGLMECVVFAAYQLAGLAARRG